MYIVYVIGNTSEKMVFEERSEAFEYALGVSKELKGAQVNIYKASLVATVELPTEPIIVKIRKQKVVKQEKLDEVIPKVVKKYTKPPKPPVESIFDELAADTTIPSDDVPVDENIPIGARCALDNNMAVGQRKGPTGEYVYLCVDCMGQLA